ncbi:pentatricopeptide repeat-containing protein At2g03380, mitochondrial-like [Prosopis cineraria]|uniref:pentatricopeptide repeat-containing protein At2g03380, mitochondrial-like n=1 Tax=Prosopis cineraria TaxID=364024 RepID=UPI00240FE7FB|nr:pentatricopeptide repeat-containing protein At2g03380, mitochondrial-like [Prosopis cineraria]
MKLAFAIKGILRHPTHRLCLQWRFLQCAVPQVQHPSTPLEPLYLTHSSFDSVQYISSLPSFHLLSICRNINSLKNAHALLLVHGLTDDLLCVTKLVSLYGSFGFVQYARTVFDRIPSPDFYSWKVMLRWYFLNDMYSEIVPFYTRMRVSVQGHDEVVFTFVLKAACELRDVVEGMKVHCQIVKTNTIDSFVLTGLLDMYSKCGEVQRARVVFDEMFDSHVVSWTSMIAAYVQNDSEEEGLVLFNRMREGFIAGNQVTVGSLLKACTKLGYLHQGKWVHGYVIKNGIEMEHFLATCLLDMYVKCGDIRDARSVFDELSTAELVSWTAMIVGYTQRGHPDKALELFANEKWACLMPNSLTVASLLSACAQLSNTTMGKSLHVQIIKLGLDDPVVSSALVYMYAKCHMTADARDIFETITHRSVISWNSIISGYAQNGSAHEALGLFKRMRLASFLPDAVTLVCTFSSCASLGALELGSSLHALSLKYGTVSSSVYVGTALLNFYAKCGDAKSARAVFDEMRDKNSVTWSAMIGGCGMLGDGNASLALFMDMLKENLELNEVVSTTILTACSHAGMVGEGLRLFILMCKELNFVPSMKHYTCMVDLLARSGNLEAALEFINKMPVQPNVGVYGAFLHGCGLHSRFDLGEVALRRMLELHPDESCYYVLMSNLYASDGRWSQVKHVRELMKQRGLNKVPGRSAVQMDISNDAYDSMAAFA